MYSLFFGKLWRNFRIARRSLLQIHIHLSAGISDTPAHSTGERIQEKLILPILRPVAHRGIKHMAFAVHPRPHHRIRRAPYPVMWTRMHDKGHVFYTAMGDRPENWKNEFFLNSLAGGMRWGIGDAGAQVDVNLKKAAPRYADIPPKFPEKK